MLIQFMLLCFWLLRLWIKASLRKGLIAFCSLGTYSMAERIVKIGTSAGAHCLVVLGYIAAVDQLFGWGLMSICLKMEICSWLCWVALRSQLVGRTASVPARFAIIEWALRLAYQSLVEAWRCGVVQAGLALTCQRVILAGIAWDSRSCRFCLLVISGWNLCVIARFWVREVEISSQSWTASSCRCFHVWSSRAIWF